jgi:hypothetical protein
VKTGGVDKNKCPRGSQTGNPFRAGNLGFKFVFRGIGLMSFGPEVTVRPAGPATSRNILKRPGAFIDFREIEKDLNQLPVLGVAMKGL